MKSSLRVGVIHWFLGHLGTQIIYIVTQMAALSDKL